MNDQKMEQELRQFDFSHCHVVREQLLHKLLTMQQHKKPWQSARLSDEELDCVAAAGQNHEEKPFEHKQ